MHRPAPQHSGSHGTPEDSPELAAALRWLFAAFGLWLILVTWPLWSGTSPFPQVPWFRWGCTVPLSVDWLALGTCLICLVLTAATPPYQRGNRFALGTFALGWTILLLLNQQRCQPWAYQWWVISLILATTRGPLTVRLLQVLTIGLYAHSAISKLDASFCQGLGQDFLRHTLDWLNFDPPARGTLGWWPLLFPLGEMLAAAGLAWKRTRRAACWLALAMHLWLLFILGPWGLSHSAGVLVWNGFFLAQNWLIFGPISSRALSPSAALQPSPSPTNPSLTNVVQPTVPARISIEAFKFPDTIALAVTLLAVGWPLTEPLGWCDLWPAWGLYAQHGERLQWRITASAWDKLDRPWRESAQSLGTDDAGQAWWSMNSQRVSLALTRAPVYPQNRFAAGIILDIARREGFAEADVAATWIHPAHRWTGTARADELTGLAALARAADSGWWNSRPRDTFFGNRMTGLLR